MNYEKNKDSSVFELCMKDLLIQIFKEGKTKSFEEGPIKTMNTISTNIGVLARITKDKALTSMYMDLNMIIAHVKNSLNDKILKRLSKEELQKSGRVSEKSLGVILNLIDSFEDFTFIERNMVQGEKLVEKIKQNIIILPATERENIIYELHTSINNAFNRAIHEEVPKLMEDFYENIVDALEKECFEDIPKIFEAEKLKWHSLDIGFP